MTELTVPQDDSVPRWLRIVIALLVIERCVYHLAYVARDPFAWVTLSDGQVYEDAARDILAHPPLGSAPFYLQALYAYLLAFGLGLSGHVLGGLCLQLIVAGLGFCAFYFAARACFGARAAAISSALLLALPELAFYENKYLSVALGIATCSALVWSFVRFAQKPDAARAAVFGVCAGLAVLGRPNLLLALPFSGYAAWLVTEPARAARLRQGAWFAFGGVLALLPLALRNWLVIGRATVFPSHGGGIPFFIGNNPKATGLWSDAAGLLSGQVLRERGELAQRLGLPSGAGSDAAIGSTLYHRAFAFIAEHPAAWIGLELKKLWYMLGNHPFVHDFDWLGERELLGALFPIGLPFGVVLGLGVLGAVLLTRHAFALARNEPATAGGVITPRFLPALLIVLLGISVSMLAANLLWFTAAQNRLPLVMPLAFVAGPSLAAGFESLRASRAALLCAGLLSAQAFIPRVHVERPSAVHYFNLASAEEVLGLDAQALSHYVTASERNPRQALFWLRRAHLAQKLGAFDDARFALVRLHALPDLPPDIARAADAASRALPPPPPR